MNATQKQLAIWLGICALMVCLMVAVGGLTRLTGSGLSIVQWQPVRGIIPPLNEANWRELFSQYQTSPQYQKINHGMSLQEFEGIFWLEFIHRFLGRLAGAVFFLPFVYFAVKKAITPALAWRFAGIFALGAAQGVIGWLMVKSGLVDHPSVSPYRLAFHLGMGFLLFGLLFWTFLDQFPRKPAGVPPRMRRLSWVVIGFIIAQVLLGAFVAGLDAGLAYNSFPTMNSQWIPDGLAILQPGWRNFFENPTTVQFEHRVFAGLVTLHVLLLWRRGWKHRAEHSLHTYFKLLLLALLAQFTLGILTLLYQVPVALASLHQIGALVLFAVALRIAHGLRPMAESAVPSPDFFGGSATLRGNGA